MGTGTEINPARQPSQKPGIQFPLKGRKRPLCRACQTTVAHTLHMGTDTAVHPLCTHIHMRASTQTPCTTCTHAALGVPHRFAECTHARSPHSHVRLTSRAHMHSRIHTPTADSIHAHTRALTPPACIYTETPHTHAYSLGSQTLILKVLVGEAVEGGGRGSPRAAPGESGLMGTRA